VKRPEYHPALHAFAVLTALATFPLIFMGGLVTSHQAGMSVPDWPNSYGYNMFLFPPRLWVGGIFYEHTHRLMGTVVGMLSIALAITAWRVDKRPWVKWLCAAVLGAVIIQGILGGLRVVLVKLNLAVIHGCLAQAVFCLTALAAAATSRWWHSVGGVADPAPRAASSRPPTVALAAIATFLIFGQLIVGALMRHYHAGLAITDLPLAYGKWLPPTDAAGLKGINQMRAWDAGGNLEPVTLGQIWLHFGHRLGAIGVTIAVLALVIHTFVRRRDERLLARPAGVLVALLLAQLALGVLVVLYRKPADIASVHVAVGALTLVTTFTMAVRAMRIAATARSAIQTTAVDGARRGIQTSHAAPATIGLAAILK
jgi:cytochrome c oxidase assembly protein subunit 15